MNAAREKFEFYVFENQFHKIFNATVAGTRLLMFVVCGVKIGKFFGKPQWREYILKATWIVGMLLFEISFQIF